MAPSNGRPGGPAAGEGSTTATRSSRSDRIGPAGRYSDDRPAAAPTVGGGGIRRLDKCDAPANVEEEEAAAAVARRGYNTGFYPNTAPRRPPTGESRTASEARSRRLGKRVVLEGTSGKGAPADSDGVQQTMPRCGCYRDPAPRRPTPFGEGTSADGAEEAVRTCGHHHTDTAPRHHTPVGGIEGGRSCLHKLVEVSGGVVPDDGFEHSVARCGRRNPVMLRRHPSLSLPDKDPMPCAQTGTEMAAAFCIPVAAGGPGYGGGRGDRGAYIYGCTSMPRAFKLAPTSDLAPEDPETRNTCVRFYYDKETGRQKGGALVTTLKHDVSGNMDSNVESEISCEKDNYELEVMSSALEKEGSQPSDVPGLSTLDGSHAELRVSNNEESIPPELEVPDFVCSDRGGWFGCNKGKWTKHYISKMNHYLKAGSVRDIKPVFDTEGRNNSSLRYEELKTRCRDLAEVPSFLSTCASVKSSGADTNTQIFVDISGSTISIQKNLSKIDINVLMEAAFVRAGVKLSDFYSTFAGKILEPNQLMSYYQIPRDSTIKVNARLRGGCAGHKNWDAVISDLNRYQSLPLPDNLLLPEQANRNPPVEVKYLAHPLQIRFRKVLIYLCRKHYSGISFGGNFTSSEILFDSDGNVSINAAPDPYSEPSGLLDYNAISEIFDSSLGEEDNRHPHQLFHLIRFLSATGPRVDCQSKAVIAFITNHVSLLSHTERIQITGILDMLFERLGSDDLAAFITCLKPFDWALRLEQVPAMHQTYYYRSWHDKDGTVRVPYYEDGVSLLRFSYNFFKHHPWFTLDELDAAFSLVTEDKDFLAHLLFKILIRFKSQFPQPCPASVESFIDQVVAMLGDHTVDCERDQMPGDVC